MKINEIIQIIDHTQNPLINSMDADGIPVSRAMMGVRHRENLEAIYFSTNTSSNKVSELKNNSKSSLYFFDPNQFVGILVKGEMEVTKDTESKQKVWRQGDEMYYPKGIDDPDFTVLKFKPTALRVYSNFKSKDILL